MTATDDPRILIQAPCEALRPFVRRFLVIESTAERRDVHLPDTGFIAAFRFRGDCRLDGGAPAPRAAISGLRSTVRNHAHSRDHAVVVAAFTATGAAALLRGPLEEFADTTADLDTVLGRRSGLDRLQDQLSEAASHAQRIRLVEDLLLARTAEARPDPLVAAAVAMIERTRARMRVEELTRRIGLSQSALERRFRRLVGVSPRRFASLVRLRNVARLHEEGADLTTIAHAAGYSDQPHLSKDFKRFTGLPPGAFFARATAR
jgi:methylphosphotriester-DNA--protein-cysteine methyltransferase